MQLPKLSKLYFSYYNASKYSKANDFCLAFYLAELLLVMVVKTLGLQNMRFSTYDFILAVLIMF